MCAIEYEARPDPQICRAERRVTTWPILGVYWRDNIPKDAPGNERNIGELQKRGAELRGGSLSARPVSGQPVMDGYRWMQWLRSAGDWEDLLDRLDEDRRQR